MERYIVVSEGMRRMGGSKGKVEVSVGYNLQLDACFGHGYALKCAKINKRYTKGVIYLEEGGKLTELDS